MNRAPTSHAATSLVVYFVGWCPFGTPLRTFPEYRHGSDSILSQARPPSSGCTANEQGLQARRIHLLTHVPWRTAGARRTAREDVQDALYSARALWRLAFCRHKALGQWHLGVATDPGEMEPRDISPPRKTLRRCRVQRYLKKRPPKLPRISAPNWARRPRRNLHRKPDGSPAKRESPTGFIDC
jgi:hypothetical protein